MAWSSAPRRGRSSPVAATVAEGLPYAASNRGDGWITTVDGMEEALLTIVCRLPIRHVERLVNFPTANAARLRRMYTQQAFEHLSRE